MFNYIIVKKREYIFIILTATIFFLLSFTYSFSKENVFTVDDVKIEGKKDLNFSRDKYINQAFKNSFETMISKILLTKDLNKVKNIKLDTIKGLIDSFQILDESFKGQKYSATFKIFYNQKKIKKFLSKKNISFIQPKNISTLFYPLLFVNDEVKNLSENYFYNEWGNNKIENELINFILPIDDLDDIKKIKENKNRIEDLKIEDFVNKYNLENFVFTFMDYKNNKLNVYIKANFNNSMKTKNLSYELSDINNKKELPHNNLQESFSIYFPRLSSTKQGYIDWKWDTTEIENFICGFDEPYTGAMTFIQKEKVYLKDCYSEFNDGPFHPFQSGIIYKINNNSAYIATKSGTLIVGKILNEKNVNIINNLNLGIRLYTPYTYLEESMLHSTEYSPNN